MTATWTAESEQARTEFGVSVATAVELNGDGYSDVIVGARFFDNGQRDEGERSSTTAMAEHGWRSRHGNDVWMTSLPWCRP